MEIHPRRPGASALIDAANDGLLLASSLTGASGSFVAVLLIAASSDTTETPTVGTYGPLDRGQRLEGRGLETVAVNECRERGGMGGYTGRELFRHLAPAFRARSGTARRNPQHAHANDAVGIESQTPSFGPHTPNHGFTTVFTSQACRQAARAGHSPAPIPADLSRDRLPDMVFAVP
jgi:hypothetical protein